MKNLTQDQLEEIYTVNEIRKALVAAEAKLAEQAPYFYDRLLSRIEKFKTALGEN